MRRNGFVAAAASSSIQVYDDMNAVSPCAISLEGIAWWWCSTFSRPMKETREAIELNDKSSSLMEQSGCAKSPVRPAVRQPQERGTND